MTQNISSIKWKLMQASKTALVHQRHLLVKMYKLTLTSMKKANTKMNLKGKISYWNDFLQCQDMARVDSSRPSITQCYDPWAKPHPFLPKEFPLLVCSREETHSCCWKAPTDLKDHKELVHMERNNVEHNHVVQGKFCFLLRERFCYCVCDLNAVNESNT